MASSLAKNVLKFAGFTVSLGIIGILFGVLFAFIFGWGIGENTFGAIGLAFLGFIAGYLLGIILGIILMKKWLRQRGSLVLGIAGGVIGAVLTVLMGVAWETDSILLLFLMFFTTPVLCLAGFYLKR
jgi:hypothetical protein